MAEDPFAAGADIDMDKVRALGAADEIKAGVGKFKDLVGGPMQGIADWFLGNVAKGEAGVSEIIKGVVNSDQTKQTKDESAEFKAAVIEALEASDYGTVCKGVAAEMVAMLSPEPEVDFAAAAAAASPEAKAAAEAIKGRVGEAKGWPAPFQLWFKSSVAKGPSGISDIIKGVIKHEGTAETKDKPAAFTAEVRACLEASDYGALAAAVFPPVDAAAASPEAKAAAEAIKGRVGDWKKLEGTPMDGIYQWAKGNAAKGGAGVTELINAVVNSDKTAETAGKPDDFKTEVAACLEASDYGELAKAVFA